MRLKYILLLALALPLAAAGTESTQQLPTLKIDSLTFHYTEGVRLSSESELEEAFAEFDKALSIDSCHAPSLYEVAKLYTLLGRGEMALLYGERAAALDPDNRWYKSQLGYVLIATGRYDEALELYKDMTSGRFGFNPDDYRALAMLYYQKGEKQQALAMFDSMEMRMGFTPEIIEYKRTILIEEGKTEEAIRQTEKYIASAPYDEDNRIVLADLYGYTGQDSLARRTLEQVLVINPDNAEAQKRLAPEKPEETAEDLIRKGDIEGALTLLKKEAEQPTEEPSINTFLGILEIETYLGRADSVEKYSRRAIAALPHVASFYVPLSNALMEQGRGKEAVKTLTEAIKLTPSNVQKSSFYGMMGDIYHLQGNNKKTFAEYEKALKLYPDNALVLNNYAYFLSVEGLKLDKALEMASRAIELHKNFATYLDTYAWVLYKRGDFAGAKKAMQQALPLDREHSAELLIHYGDILYALGDDFLASVYWKRARDGGYEPAEEIEQRLSGSYDKLKRAQ